MCPIVQERQRNNENDVTTESSSSGDQPQTSMPSSREISWTRWDALALFGLAVSVVIFYRRIVFGEEIFFARDVLRYVIPARAYAADRLMSGEVPL